MKYCNLHDGDREGNRVPILEVSAENSPGNSDSSYPFKSMFWGVFYITISKSIINKPLKIACSRKKFNILKPFLCLSASYDQNEQNQTKENCDKAISAY